MAGDDHAAVFAIADETRTLGGRDKDAAVDASAVHVIWQQGTLPREILLVDRYAGGGLTHVYVAILSNIRTKMKISRQLKLKETHGRITSQFMMQNC